MRVSNVIKFVFDVPLGTDWRDEILVVVVWTSV